MTTAIIINHNGMGHGDDVLGLQILQTALNKAAVFRQLEAIVFYNGGVKILFEGSECLPVLAALHDLGVELIACGTCVNHFASPEKVCIGTVGTMDDIVAVLARAKKVITL